MEKTLKLLSILKQASDYSTFALMEVYIDYQLFHLLSLVKYEKLNQKTLSKKLGMTEPALSMKLKLLERNDLIYKKKSTEDKRNFILVLSDKGEEILTKNEHILGNRAKEIFNHFSVEELETLETLINKMNEHGFR